MKENMLKHGDEKEQYRVSWLLKEKELWLLILINILFFFPVIFLQETFFFRDLLSAYLPRQQAFKELVRFGELPLWDPYIHGGKPFLGNPANSTLNPFNVLYCILPIFRAFNLSIVLHFTSSAVFSYACCRTLRLQPLSSFVGAVVYEFCGCSLSLGNLPGFLLDMPYLPLMLMGWHLLFQEKTTKWFVFTALIGTVQMLSGSHELNMISLLFLLGWSLLCPFPRISIARKIGLWLLLGVFLAGISAIQILPTLEMLSLASKARGINPETALLWSISPLRLPELFFPGFSGEMESITWMDHYWGNQVVDGVIPFILSLYFGFPVFMLAMLGGLVSSKRLSLPLRGRVLLMLTFFIALLFSLGRYVPFTSSLYSFLASFLFSRYPSRILIAGVLPIALLAGFGFEVYSSTVWSRNRRGLLNTLHIVFWTVTAMLVIFTLAFKYSDLFATLFQKVFFHRLIGEHALQNLIQSFMHGTLACLAATLLFQFRRLQPVRWQPWLLVGIVLVDLLAAGRQLNPSAPELLFSTPPAVGEIRQAIGQGRLFHDTEQSKNINVPSFEIAWLYRWHFERLTSYIPTFFLFPLIFHDDLFRLGQHHTYEITEYIKQASWEERMPWLSAGGVTTILSFDDVSVPGLRHIAEIPNRSSSPFHVYQNTRAAERIAFVRSWEFVESDTEAFQAVMVPENDPRYHAVLQAPPVRQWEAFFGRQQEVSLHRLLEKLQNSSLERPRSNSQVARQAVNIEQQYSSAKAVHISLAVESDGILVFSEPFYPGWKIFVDGQAVPILRANYAFSGIFLAQGRHDVKRIYRPSSVMFGGILSLVFLGLLIIGGYIKKSIV